MKSGDAKPQVYGKTTKAAGLPNAGSIGILFSLFGKTVFFYTNGSARGIVVDAVNVKKEGKYVVFSVGEEIYSLGIEEVLEIIRPRPITSIAGVKGYIEGVIHLRGNIIPIVNLRGRLGLPVKQLDKHGRVLIVKGENDEKIGLVVDHVKMVTNMKDSEMEGTPDPLQSQTDGFVVGMAKQDDQVIGMLDLRRLLYPKGIEGE